VRLLLLAFALLSTGYGGNLSTISGIVTDPSGAAIPDARVAVLSGGTNKDTRSTDIDGRFTTRLLTAGTYIVDISKSGFEAQQCR